MDLRSADRLLLAPVPAGAMAPYAGLFQLYAGASGVVAAVVEVLELALARAYLTSLVFLALGLAAGEISGRALARRQRKVAEAVPVADRNAAPLPVVAPLPRLLLVAAAALVVGIVLAVTVAAAVPLPLAAGFAALALQNRREAQAVQAVEAERGGTLLFPARRASFAEAELRLLPAPEAAQTSAARPAGSRPEPPAAAPGRPAGRGPASTPTSRVRRPPPNPPPGRSDPPRPRPVPPPPGRRPPPRGAGR